MSVKEMAAGTHRMYRNAESNGSNGCKPKTHIDSPHMVTVSKNLQLLRKYVIDKL